MSHLRLVVDRPPDRAAAQHEVDRLLRRIRLAVLARESLLDCGASEVEVARQTDEIAQLRSRLAALVSGGDPYPTAA